MQLLPLNLLLQVVGLAAIAIPFTAASPTHNESSALAQPREALVSPDFSLPDIDEIYAESRAAVIQHLINTTRADDGGSLNRRDPERLDRCVAVKVDKHGGIKVWNILLERDHLYDDICGRQFLAAFRKRCNWFPVYIHNWRCDRLDYILFGTDKQVPWGTVWMQFITKNACSTLSHGPESIKEATGGAVDLKCLKIKLDGLPAPLDFKEMRNLGF